MLTAQKCALSVSVVTAIVVYVIKTKMNLKDFIYFWIVILTITLVLGWHNGVLTINQNTDYKDYSKNFTYSNLKSKGLKGVYRVTQKR